jgi:anti-sigma B factor antagonist
VKGPPTPLEEVEVTDLQLDRIASSDATATVRLSGDVDMASAPRLRSLLEELVDSGTKRIVLDCRSLSFLDSSGIGVLVAARTRMGDDSELVLESPPSHVRKVLDITGMDSQLTVVP